MTELQENRLAQILDEYLASRRSGGADSPEELIRRHPDLAEDLADCLSCLNLVERGFEEQESGAPDQLPGGVLGDFRIIREVGRGGMGVVYEAEQISLGRRVALKVLPFAAVFDDRHLQRFKNEAQAAASLHHTHIVPVHAVGHERGVHYYAMQFIEGRTLAQVVEELRRGPLEPAQPLSAITQGKSTRSAEYCRAVAGLGIQAAEALSHAHARGIIHRDIKPGNLMVDPLGHLWITDFGLATFQRGDAALTLTGDLLGTVRYMSPEQAQANRIPIDHRTDVYSLGVTLYELLTLEPAFPGKGVQEVMEAIAFREPRPARQLNPSIPVDFETILLKAMAKVPGERYEDADALRADLVRLLEHKPIRAKRPSWLVRAERWARRHRPLVLVGIAALLVLSAALIWTNLRVTRAYRETEVQRLRAEADFARARKAVREMLSQAGAEELSDLPLMGPMRRKLLESAVAFYEEWLDEALADPELRAEVAEAYEDLAGVKRLLGDHAAAAEYYTEAADYAADPARRARILHRLGTCREDQGDLDGADAALQDALALRRARRALPWAATLNALARVAALRKDDATQARYLDAAIELLEKESSNEAKSELARTVGTRVAQRFMANREDAFLSTARALELLRGIGDEAGASRKHRQQLARALVTHAHVCLAMGDPKRATPPLREAIALLEPLAREFPFLPQVRTLLCDANWELGRALRSADSEEHLREAVRGGEELALLFPSIPRRERRLALYHVELAAAVHRTDPETTAKSFTRADGLFRGLANRFPGEPGYAIDVSQSLFRRSDTLRFPDNVARLREAIEITRPVFEADRDRAEYRNVFATLHLQTGGKLADAGRRDEAEVEYREAIELWRDRDDLDARKGLTTSLMNLGHVLRDKKKMQPAEAALRESMALGDRIRVESPAERANHALCRLHLGGLLKMTGRLEDAMVVYREAAQLLGQIAMPGRQAEELHADAYYSLGRAFQLLRSSADSESLAARRRAIELREKYVDGYPYLNGQRNRLATEAHLLANTYRELERPAEVGRYFEFARRHREYLVLHAKNKPLFRSQLAWGLHDHSDFLVAQGNVQLAREQVERAIALQRHAIADRPENKQYRARLISHFNLLGGVAKAQRDHAALSDAARQLAALAAGQWETHRLAADKYWGSFVLTFADANLVEGERMALAREQYIRATRQLRRAIELRGDAGGLHRRLAWALATCPFPELLDLKAAEDSAARALELGEMRAHQILAIARVRGEQWEGAVASLGKSMKETRGDRYDWYCLSVVKAQRGDRAGARIAYRKAVQKDKIPGDPASLFLRRLAVDAMERSGTEDSKTELEK